MVVAVFKTVAPTLRARGLGSIPTLSAIKAACPTSRLFARRPNQYQRGTSENEDLCLESVRSRLDMVCISRIGVGHQVLEESRTDQPCEFAGDNKSG